MLSRLRAQKYESNNIFFYQNVQVASTGSCGSIPGAREAEDSTLDTNALISLQAMKRFGSYKLVAKRNPESFIDGPSGEDTQPSNIIEGRQSESSGSLKVRKWTRDGFEYVSDDLPSVDFGPALASFSDESLRNLRQRNLAIIGDDTRTLITNTLAAPYRAIGEIDYGNNAGGCTATMISRNVAMTSGYCVHSGQGGSPYSVKTLALGRYNDNGVVENQYGEWTVVGVDVFQEWIDSSERTRDYAFLSLEPKTDDEGCSYLYPGDVTGYIGFRTASVGDALLNRATVTGYPFDKDSGEMWTSGTCTPNWEVAETNFGYHYCDTDDAGSAIVSSDGRYQALGVLGYGDTTKNGAPIIEEPSLYSAIYAYSMRDTPPRSCDDTEAPSEAPSSAPSLSPSSVPTVEPSTEPEFTDDEEECPCAAVEFVLFRLACRVLNFSRCFSRA